MNRGYSNRGTLLDGMAVAWFLALAIAALASGWIGKPDDLPMLPPSWAHWLGTDLLGRDFFLRLAEGGGRTIGIAGAACLLSVLVGGVWGIFAGFSRGQLSELLSRLIEVALAVPSLLLALVLLAALGPSEAAVALAVGVGGAATFARLTRAESVQVSGKAYILAARALGAHEFELIGRHLLPNVASAFAAFAVLQFGWALANTASLTFLGFGGSISAPEWGRMLGDARLVFWQAPDQALAIGMAIALTVLAAQRLAERWGGCG
jgi:peptide/nickel transport system permease protein